MNTSRTPIDRLLLRTASETNVPIGKIAGDSREKKIVDARQIFCCCAYYSGYTYEAIGEFINRDHSSVIHLCNERPLSKDSVEKIRTIRNGSDPISIISSLAFKLYKDPNDNKTRKTLKELL